MSRYVLDEKGYNEFGVKFCECKPFDGPHPYEPGEWCSPVHVMPKAANRRLFSRVVEDATGMNHIELSVDRSEGNWPAMVQVEWEGGTILADDARRYALALLAAAEVADQANSTQPSDQPLDQGEGKR